MSYADYIRMSDAAGDNRIDIEKRYSESEFNRLPGETRKYLTSNDAVPGWDMDQSPPQSPPHIPYGASPTTLRANSFDKDDVEDDPNPFKSGRQGIGRIDGRGGKKRTTRNIKSSTKRRIQRRRKYVSRRRSGRSMRRNY